VSHYLVVGVDVAHYREQLAGCGKLGGNCLTRRPQLCVPARQKEVAAPSMHRRLTARALPLRLNQARAQRPDKVARCTKNGVVGNEHNDAERNQPKSRKSR
jgi:hypothetical protein